MGLLLKLFTMGKTAASGYGWVLLLIGLAPSVWFGVSNYQTRGALADCRAERIEDARAVTDQLIQDLHSVNDAAARASASIDAIRESSNAVREELRGVSVTCDLEPVRDGLQHHIDEVRSAREGAVAP